MLLLCSICLVFILVWQCHHSLEIDPCLFKSDKFSDHNLLMFVNCFFFNEYHVVSFIWVMVIMWRFGRSTIYLGKSDLNSDWWFQCSTADICSRYLQFCFVFYLLIYELLYMIFDYTFIGMWTSIYCLWLYAYLYMNCYIIDCMLTDIWTSIYCLWLYIYWHLNFHILSLITHLLIFELPCAICDDMFDLIKSKWYLWKYIYQLTKPPCNSFMIYLLI